MKRWYVVHTHPRSETLALINLQRQGFEVYLPQYLRQRRHARRTDWVLYPLFPRYLFVEIDLEAMRWHSIQSTMGVSYLVSQGDRPAPAPFSIIEEIKAMENKDGVVPLHSCVPFKKDEVVQIKTGAFCDQVGLFDRATDDERVIVLLDLLGRQVKVRVPVEAISAYA